MLSTKSLLSIPEFVKEWRTDQYLFAAEPVICFEITCMWKRLHEKSGELIVLASGVCAVLLKKRCISVSRVIQVVVEPHSLMYVLGLVTVLCQVSSR